MCLSILVAARSPQCAIAYRLGMPTPRFPFKLNTELVTVYPEAVPVTSNMADGSEWKGFIRKHRNMVAIFAAAGLLVAIGAVYVFVWFVSDAQSSGLVPSLLGSWSIGNLVAFIVNLIFWELLIIGIPVVVAVVFVWRWWMRLPGEERGGRYFHGRARTSRGSGGFSLLFFIAFCIKVYADGNWNAPIASFTLNYIVSSMLLILALVAIIFGVPAAVFGVWWVRREMKKP